MKRILNIAGVLLLTALLTAPAALAAGYKDEPGYIDLEWIEIPADADEIQDIDLSAVLPALAAQAKEKGDDALMQALSMVRMVRVKAYSLNTDGKATAEAVKKVQAQLDKNDWSRLVFYKDGEESVTVSTKSVDDKLVGLMIVTYEPGDSVAFVNVVGDLDLATMLSLVSEFDEDNLEEMLEGLETATGGKVQHDG
jgi:hypothetical protein